MGVLGDRLRREREMRGVTLEEISESTKISKRSLQALEEEDFDLLPGGIFNKGFVRAYARYLGIDEEQAVADYLSASNEQPPPEDQFPLEVRKKEEGTPPLNPKRSLLPLILAALALVVVVGGWTFWTKYKSQETSPEIVTAVNAPANPAPGTTPAESAVLPVSDKNATVSPATQTSEPATTPSGSSSDQGNTSSELSDPPVPSEEASKRFFRISVKAREGSWVSIVADGSTIIQGMLNVDEQREAKAGKQIVLRIGNAGGVEVSYNGKPLGVIGKEKEPRTLTFTPSGLQQ
jgi:cytoskeleton protein RodZ